MEEPVATLHDDYAVTETMDYFNACMRRLPLKRQCTTDHSNGAIPAHCLIVKHEMFSQHLNVAFGDVLGYIYSYGVVLSIPPTV
jgi:hypothetical protein